MTVDIRRAGERFHTRTGWLDSRHSFSFGPHYDPANTHFGVLMVSNDDIVAPGAGFETHPHRDMEIVTWVLDGALAHEDSTGHSAVIYPGLAQRVSAGTGIRHSEKNDARRAGADPREHDAVHFVQMWVVPDTEKTTPDYAQCDVTTPLDNGELVVVASGMPRHFDERAVSIHQECAALYAARLPANATTPTPAAPFVHVFVARGSVHVEGAGPLAVGDAARITDADGRRLRAGPDGAEVLIWEMRAALG